MSAMTDDIRITPKDLGKIPRKVAAIVCDLVNDHGVRYKADGAHVWLYNGNSKTRPYKIAASRAEETSLSFLYKWIEQNVPEYNEREVTPAALKVLAEAVSTTEHEDPSSATVGVKAEEGLPDDTEGGLRPVAEGREPFVLATGEVSEFDTDGESYWCRRCDFSKTGKASGLHFHTQAHQGKSSGADPALRERMRETKRLRAEQRRIMAEQALNVLAEQHGLKVGGVSEKEADAMRQRIADLEDQVGDLKAKLALIKEAMRA